MLRFKFRFSVLVILLFFLQVVSSYAQIAISLGDLKCVLPNTNARTESRTLKMKMSGPDISSTQFGLVGGIAFTQVAVPTMNVNSIDLSLNASKCYVRINGVKYAVPLEMFKLIPIVNFADSDYDVVMTMFGKHYGKVTGTVTEDILFHDAFLDTMMGLRLFQVDAMNKLGTSNFELPAIDGTICLNDSEKDVYNNMTSRYGFDDYMEFSKDAYSMISKKMKECQVRSYIYTDIDATINFSVSGNEIVFDGLPYFQFCKANSESADRLAMGIYRNLLQILFFAFHDDLYEAGQDELVSENICTDWLRSNPDLVRDLNPFVYSEVDEICRWASLFRYVKKHNPKKWKRFVSKVNKRKMNGMQVQTPVAMLN